MLDKIRSLKDWKATTLFLAVGLMLGYIVCIYFHTSNLPCSTFYDYLNPHLACQDKPAISKVVYLNLQDGIKNYIDVEKATDGVSDVGVYFRDLEDGPTFGVNSSKLFISASLIKLPTIMTVLRLADQDKTFLDRKILYSQEIPSYNQDFTPAQKLEVGKSYTVEDLVERALEYSDNASNELLIDELQRISPNEDLITDTFHDLGLIVPGNVSVGDLSTKSYSSLFRLLYNASFLSKDNSDKILNLLDKAKFKQGLEAGVPQGIRVASKFGERELDYVADGKNSGKVDELHDCGVIYYPNNPYLLCIMTKGTDFKVLAKVISHISQMVYEEVNSRKLQ